MDTNESGLLLPPLCHFGLPAVHPSTSNPASNWTALVHGHDAQDWSHYHWGCFYGQLHRFTKPKCTALVFAVGQTPVSVGVKAAQWVDGWDRGWG